MAFKSLNRSVSAFRVLRLKLWAQAPRHPGLDEVNPKWTHRIIQQVNVNEANGKNERRLGAAGVGGCLPSIGKALWEWDGIGTNPKYI